MKYKYQVLLPLSADPCGFVLCECDTPEAATAVIAALLGNTAAPPSSVTIRMIPYSP